MAAGTQAICGTPPQDLATGLCKEKLLEVLFYLHRFELLNASKPKHRSATCAVLFALDHSADQHKAAPAAAGGAAAAGAAATRTNRSVALKFMRCGFGMALCLAIYVMHFFVCLGSGFALSPACNASTAPLQAPRPI